MDARELNDGPDNVVPFRKRAKPKPTLPTGASVEWSMGCTCSPPKTLRSGERCEDCGSALGVAP